MKKLFDRCDRAQSERTNPDYGEALPLVLSEEKIKERTDALLKRIDELKRTKPQNWQRDARQLARRISLLHQ